jgi:hypothetical protein
MSNSTEEGSIDSRKPPLQWNGSGAAKLVKDHCDVNRFDVIVTQSVCKGLSASSVAAAQPSSIGRYRPSDRQRDRRIPSRLGRKGRASPLRCCGFVGLRHVEAVLAGIRRNVNDSPRLLLQNQQFVICSFAPYARRCIVVEEFR